MAADHDHWQTGTLVVMEEVWQGRLWSVRPMIVASDEPGLLALWKPRGTTWKTATDAPGVPRLGSRGERFARRLAEMTWVLGEFTWDLDTLWLMRPDDYHATIAGWTPEGDFIGWYVNLQEPYRKGQNGTLQTMDLMLDLKISPSGAWEWKDEDEVAVLVSAGVFSDSQVSLLRTQGERVLSEHSRGIAPFSDGWDQWKPPYSWRIPALPDRYK